MKKLIISAAIAAMSLTAAAQVNSPDADGYLARGIMMYEDQNFNGCVDQLTRLKRLQPDERQLAEADYYLAMSAARLGKGDAAALLKHFAWRYPTSPRCSTARIAIGDLLLDEGRYGDALAAYDKVNAASLDGAAAARLAYNRAYCLLKRGVYDAALPLYQSLRGNADYANAARFYEGYIYYMKDDYRRAAELLRGVDTSRRPANMADYYLCQIYFVDGDYNKALTTARRLLAGPEADAGFKTEARRVAGESLYHLGDDAQAVEMLKEYVAETDNPRPSALYILGVAQYRDGNYADAIRLLAPASALDDAMGQSANLFIGESFMHQGNYSSAMISFEKALKSDFDPAVQETAYYNYAVASTQGGKVPFGSTVNTFEEFLRSYPASRYADSIREYLVTGYMTDNNYPAALASIEAIRQPNAKVLAAKQQVLYSLGARELAAGDVNGAINHLRQGRELRTYNPSIGAETDLWLGEALYASGLYADAAASYRAYIDNRSASAENLPNARYGLAYSLFSDRKYDEAADELNRYIEAPGQKSKEALADAYNRLADCYYYRSDFGTAAGIYSKAYSINPAAGDYALFQEAVMKGYTGSPQAKIDGLRNMVTRFPKSGLVPQALLEIGESHEQLNQTDKAIDTYRTLSATYASTEQGRRAGLLLALAYVNNGQHRDAITAYKRLITTAPTSDEARQAAENLKVLCAEEGKLQEYADFINNVPDAARIEPSEIDRLTFAAAEREYLGTGKTAKLADYVEKFPDGVSRAAALAYMMEGTLKSGNNSAAATYASQLIERYPDDSRVADAYKVKADALYAQGKGLQAMEAYAKAAEAASQPYAINDARMGVLRTARDLGLHDRVIATADVLTASSTISAEQRSEARFSRALARSLSGDTAAAIDEWTQLADNLDDIYGTKAAFYIASNHYANKQLGDARKWVDKLLYGDIPYDYWYARAVILLSDICRAEGNDYEADLYLTSLQEKYPGNESDIFNMIQQRLQK